MVFIVVKVCKWWADIEAHNTSTTIEKVFRTFKSAQNYIHEQIKRYNHTLSEGTSEDKGVYKCETEFDHYGEEYTYEYNIIQKPINN